MVGKGYGMPSSHAQFVAFFSVYFSLFLLLRHQPPPAGHQDASTTHIPIPYYQRAGLAVLSVLCAATVAHSRIYLNYHKPRQVYVGIAAGVACAIGWFVVTSLGRRMGLVDWLLDLPPSRWVRLRDLTVSEDFADAGWERWEMRRRRKVADGMKKKS